MADNNASQYNTLDIFIHSVYCDSFFCILNYDFLSFESTNEIERKKDKKQLLIQKIVRH